MTLRLSNLMVWCAALLLASAAQAQVRPSESVYILLRGGATGYYGDFDGAANTSGLDELREGFSDPGFLVGGEIGYHFNENLALGLGGSYSTYPEIDGRLSPFMNNNGDDAYMAHALLRYTMLGQSSFSPFVELGGAVLRAQGTEFERNNRGGANDDLWGYGPLVGLGFDLALSPQFGFFLGAQSVFSFPDAAFDGGDAGAFGVQADEADFDILANVGGGLRYALTPPGTAVMIEGLECPAELETGETGSFAVFTNADATAPVSAMWQFGDGESGSGMTTSHSYDAPGTYTVTAMAMNGFGESSESCLVTVVEPPVFPAIAGCRATPSSVETGESVTIDATVTDADDVMVDFGDGTTASSLPARHTYAAAGSYTVRITAENANGSDSCTIPVRVSDPAPSICESITELNPVFFGYGSTTLSADARARLDENIEILRQCPDICVTINGYSDGAEPGNAQRISEARAEAVREYYIGQGLDADRFRAMGRGVAPGANPKEDPGPGDARARRADSIPSSCAGF